MATIQRPDGSVFYVGPEIPVSNILNSLSSSQELVFLGASAGGSNVVEATWARFPRGRYVIREKYCVTCCAVL